MEDKEVQELLIDTQKEYARSNKVKDKIIVLLIVLMFLEAAIGYCGFVWYESQFDYVTTEQTTETKSVDVGTNGDNANAEYNDVNGTNIMIMQHIMIQKVVTNNGKSKYTCNKS